MTERLFGTDGVRGLAGTELTVPRIDREAIAGRHASVMRPDAATLIVAGEPELDRVVPNEDTLRYLDLIPGSSFQLLEGTGHLGTVLAPDRFAAIVSRFARQL